MTKYLDSDGLAHLWEKLKSFFVAQSKIANNATTTESGFVLDARTGKVLADQITAQINSLNTSLANKLYPVGSIYISVNATNPAELFGGTWERLKDRFLLAAGDSYAAGSTGGEATHRLTIDEMPSHAHEMAPWMWAVSSGFNTGTYNILDMNTGNADSYNASKSRQKQYSESTGGGLAHNNMPPYLAVYMWKRTA